VLQWAQPSIPCRRGSKSKVTTTLTKALSKLIVHLLHATPVSLFLSLFLWVCLYSRSDSPRAASRRPHHRRRRLTTALRHPVMTMSERNDGSCQFSLCAVFNAENRLFCDNAAPIPFDVALVEILSSSAHSSRTWRSDIFHDVTGAVCDLFAACSSPVYTLTYSFSPFYFFTARRTTNVCWRL